jgi:hypothetical protein
LSDLNIDHEVLLGFLRVIAEKAAEARQFLEADLESRGSSDPISENYLFKRLDIIKIQITHIEEELKRTSRPSAAFPPTAIS